MLKKKETVGTCKKKWRRLEYILLFLGGLK